MEYNAAQWGSTADDVPLSDFPGRKFLPDTLQRIRWNELESVNAAAGRRVMGTAMQTCPYLPPAV